MNFYEHNIDDESALTLGSLPPFGIVSGEQRVRVAIYWLEKNDSAVHSIFTTILWIGDTSADRPFFFRCDDIISAHMKANGLTFARYRFCYGVATDEQPDYSCVFMVLHNVVNLPADRIEAFKPGERLMPKPRFLTDFNSRVMYRHDREALPIRIFSASEFYLHGEAVMKDGRSFTFMNFFLKADVHIFAPGFSVEGMISSALEAMAKAGGGSADDVAMITLSVWDRSRQNMCNPLKIWLTDEAPSAEVSYSNQYLCQERIHLFGEWSEKITSTSSVANVGGAQQPYNSDSDLEISITSHPVDAFTASCMSLVGLVDPRLDLKLLAGHTSMEVSGILTKSEIEIDPDSKDMSRLKLTVNPGKRPVGFSERDSIFTEHFTSQFT